MDSGIFHSVIRSLQGHSVLDFITTLLSTGDSTIVSTESETSGQPWIKTRQQLLSDAPRLLELLLLHDDEKAMQSEVLNAATTYLMNEITSMAKKSVGWHFSVKHASAQQVLDFSIKDMADQLEKQTPGLWNMLGKLLTSDKTLESRRARFHEHDRPSSTDPKGAEDDWSEEDEYWARDFDGELDTSAPKPGEGDKASKRQQRAGARNEALHRIKRVVITSILLVSTNQRCNALAGVIGLFCHSVSAPELMIEMLAHTGLSISTTSIHAMVASLSAKAQEEIRKLAKTRLVAVAYDNFDMDFSSSLPTIEKRGSTLQHATSAIIFPLKHGVTADDLRCSADLWGSSPVNPTIPHGEWRKKRTIFDCLPDEKQSSPSKEVQIMAWHFRNALVTYSEPFKKFKAQLGLPETVLQIPKDKMEYIPCRAMDINQSTADGQAKILEDILGKQAGLGDPNDPETPGMTDISEYILLVHGDLHTGELIEAMKRSRSIEDTPVLRMQSAEYFHGHFHYLMGIGEAMWRMHIEQKSARAGPNSLYQHMCKIRPHDSGRLTSKFSFRAMHDLIHQAGAARMLDCWRVLLCKPDSMFSSLEEYADSAPAWEDIMTLSLTLVQTFVDKPDSADQEFRNNTLILRHLLYYIEVAHAIKYGDIGRVEKSFLHWAYIFKSVGKHKYAAALIKAMIDMKYLYDDKLKHAIRMHWLLNINGKEDGFRAVDWVVELLNLHIKVTYGSSGSARTFQWIQKQSSIIHLLRQVHVIIQENFHLLHRTMSHGQPNLNKTLETMLELLRDHNAHEEVEGRSSYDLKDHLRDGMRIFQTEKGQVIDDNDSDDDSTVDEPIEAEELQLEDLDIF